MANSPRLGMRLMATNDLQKEVIFNEAVVVLDAFTVRSAKNRTNTPPGSPVNGDTYIVGTAGTGVFSGHNNKIALYFSGWRFYTPFSKAKFFNETTSTFWTYNSGSWTEDPAGTPSALDDLTNVGGAAPEDGQVLTFNETEGYWEPQTLPGNSNLSDLPDVDVDGGPADGQVLAWDEGDGKWKPVTPATGGGGATQLGDLSDVEMAGLANGYIFTWDTAAGKAMFKEYAFPAAQLNNLLDVNTSGRQPNDALVWNGSIWAPSSVVFNYSFEGMLDGPGSMDGYANHFLVVDPTESFLMFRDLQSLIDDLDDFAMSDLTDVTAPSDSHVGKAVVLTKVGSNFIYNYQTLTDYSVQVWKDEDVSAMTTKVTRFTFKGFNITEPTPDQIVIEAQNALGFQADGVEVEDAVSEINFIGPLTVSVEDGVLTLGVDVPPPTVTLAALEDVDLETEAPVDGNVLRYDALTEKWVPGVGGGGGGPIIDGEVEPALYELGPFAPPVPGMFPNNTHAPSAIMTSVPNRGLVFSAGPKATASARHGYRWRTLANDEAPWVVTCRVIPTSLHVTGHAAGIALGRAFNGHYVFIDVGNSEADSGIVRFGWVNGATEAETILTSEPNLYKWLRLAFDGNHIRAYVSADGLIFSPFGAAHDPAGSLAGTPDRVGIEARSQEVTDGSASALYTYYEDPDFPASARTQQGVVALGVGGLQDVDLETVPPLDGQTIVWNESEGKWLPGDAGGGGSLAELEDVDLTTPPEDGQALVWDEGEGKWIAGAGVPETLGAIGDVDLTGLEDGQTLIWVEGDSKWVPGQASPETLGDIGDVDMTTPPEDGQSLVWDETSGTWIPGAGVPEELGDIGDVDLTVAPVNGNSLVFDGLSGTWKAGVGLGNVAADFDLSFFIPGEPDADVIATFYLTARDFTLETDLEDSFAYAGTAPSSEVEFDIRKNGVSIGALVFAFATNTGTFDFPADIDFLPGDRLEIWTPASAAGIEDIAITIAGTRA